MNSTIRICIRFDSENEYYSYSYSFHFQKTNTIRIRIRFKITIRSNTGLSHNISASTWPNIKIKDSFEILRTSRFQNWPYFLNLVKIWWRYWPKTNWVLFIGTLCIFKLIKFKFCCIVNLLWQHKSQIMFWVKELSLFEKLCIFLLHAPYLVV